MNDLPASGPDLTSESGGGILPSGNSDAGAAFTSAMDAASQVPEGNPGITNPDGSDTSSVTATTPDSGLGGSGSGSGSGDTTSGSTDPTTCCGNACSCGGTNVGVTGMCCTYLGQLNLSMQRAFAPYTNSCSSCGGSGINNSGGSSSPTGDGSSGDGSSGGTPYVLSFIYGEQFITPIPPGYIYFDSNIYSEISSIYISKVDMNGVPVESFVSSLSSNNVFSIYNEYDSNTYIVFGFQSQISNPFYDIISVRVNAYNNTLANNTIVSFCVASASTTGHVVDICPACAGTGLEGSTGGTPGLITAVFNGSAGWAGANINIFGVRQS